MAEYFAFGDLQSLSDLVEPRDFRQGQGGLTSRAVAIDPMHVMNFLTRGFHEIAQERAVIGVEIHSSTNALALIEVKRSHAARPQ